MTLWTRVGDVNITLDVNRCVPSISLVDDPYLLHQKTSEKPLALDMGRKAAATSVALN
jgi:hypothetical protein